MLLLLLQPAATATAATAPDPNEAITFPFATFVEGDPGERVTSDIIVKNQTTVDVDFLTEVLDMRAGGGRSTAPEYVAVGDAPRGAGAWIEPLEPDAFTIPAGTERSVPVAIEIPEDAGAGGHYAAIMFTANDPRPSGQFRIDVTYPVPVLITVGGAFQRSLRASLAPQERWRWSGGRAAWLLELHNDGDVHEVVSGRVRIDGLLSAPDTAPIRPGILLPGEHRRQRVTFDLRDAPDLIGADARIERDDARPVTATAASLVVLPWWLLLVLGASALIIGWRLRARRRARASWPADEAAEDEGSWDPSAHAG